MTSSSNPHQGIARGINTGRGAPCLGLALVAAGLLWAGLGSAVVMLIA